MIGYGPRLSFMRLVVAETEEDRNTRRKENQLEEEIELAREILPKDIMKAFIESCERYEHPTSYQTELVNELKEAKNLPTEVMEAYISSYESYGFPRIRRILGKIFGGSEEWEGNGDPAKINAYRQVLEKRLYSVN